MGWGGVAIGGGSARVYGLAVLTVGRGALQHHTPPFLRTAAAVAGPLRWPSKISRTQKTMSEPTVTLRTGVASNMSTGMPVRVSLASVCQFICTRAGWRVKGGAAGGGSVGGWRLEGGGRVEGRLAGERHEISLVGVPIRLVLRNDREVGHVPQSDRVGGKVLP